MVTTGAEATLIIDGSGLTLGQLRDYEAGRPVVRLADDARRRCRLPSTRSSARSDARRGDLRNQHRLRRLCQQGDSRCADTQAPAQPHSQPRLRQRCAAPRDDRAAHAPAQGEQPAAGCSGLTVVVEMLLDLLADVVPVIPEQGSVGASGDLAPLAHLALVLIGEGEACTRTRCSPIPCWA